MPTYEEEGEKEIQVVEVPEEAKKAVADFLKDQKVLGDGGAGATSGTGCRFTTHGDLHCGDTDMV